MARTSLESWDEDVAKKKDSCSRLRHKLAGYGLCSHVYRIGLFDFDMSERFMQRVRYRLVINEIIERGRGHAD